MEKETLCTANLALRAAFSRRVRLPSAGRRFMAEKLYFDVRYHGGLISATANGILGFFTAPDFKSRIAAWIEPGVTGIHIDLKALTHIDSAGIAVLLQTVRSCADQQIDFKLLNPPPALRTIFEKSGLTASLG
jgi:anti-anti-sigma factor